MAISESNKYELIDQLADEFTARYRKGERPALKEYLDRYPELADDIRQLLPAMVEMEHVKEEIAAPADGAGGPPRRAKWATIKSCARSAMAAWALSMRRNRSRWAGAWP